MLDRQGFSLAFVFDLSYAFFSFLKFLSKLERALGGMFWVFTRFFFEYFSVLLAVFATGCITWLDSDSDFSYNLCFLAINSPFVFDRKSLIFLHYSSGFYFLSFLDMLFSLGSFYFDIVCFVLYWDVILGLGRFEEGAVFGGGLGRLIGGLRKGLSVVFVYFGGVLDSYGEIEIFW